MFHSYLRPQLLIQHLPLIPTETKVKKLSTNQPMLRPVPQESIASLSHYVSRMFLQSYGICPACSSFLEEEERMEIWSV